jgi:hypothetical protein
MNRRLLALFLAGAGAMYGAGREFDRVVDAIEHHYGVKQTHIPFMGLASFVVRVAHPAGTSGFRLAMFENMPATGADRGELDRFMEQVSREGLHAIVVTHSTRDDESTYILAGDAGKSTRLLIATFDRREATVIEAEVNLETLLRVIGSPDQAHSFFRKDRDDRDSRF